MKKIRLKYMSVNILALLFTLAATAQNVYTLDENNSTLIVAGTSSLHDWEMEATGFSAETALKIEDASVSEIQYIDFSLPVAKLESEKNTMNNKAHDALKEKEFPQIYFSLEKDKPLGLSGNNATIEGMLTVAGKTKKIKVPVVFNRVSDQQFEVNGNVRLKMSEFGIEPPAALFGTIKADNEVEVKFNFEFSKSN